MPNGKQGQAFSCRQCSSGDGDGDGDEDGGGEQGVRKGAGGGGNKGRGRGKRQYKAEPGTGEKGRSKIKGRAVAQRPRAAGNLQGRGPSASGQQPCRPPRRVAGPELQ